MSALGLPALRAALLARLTSHEATAALSWPAEGEPGDPHADYGRVSFVSGVEAGRTWGGAGAEQLFDVHYFTGGESDAEGAAEAISGALASAPIEADGYDAHTAGVATRILDESAAGGHGFHVVVTPRLLIRRLVAA